MVNQVAACTVLDIGDNMSNMGNRSYTINNVTQRRRKATEVFSTFQLLMLSTLLKPSEEVHTLASDRLSTP